MVYIQVNCATSRDDLLCANEVCGASMGASPRVAGWQSGAMRLNESNRIENSHVCIMLPA